MTRVIVFDDGGGNSAKLGPLTDLRPALTLRTGALTTLERLAHFVSQRKGSTLAGVFVPEPLADLTRAGAQLPVNDPAVLAVGGKNPTSLLINARCVVPGKEIRDLAVGEALTGDDDEVIAARLNPADAETFFVTHALPKSCKKNAWPEAPMLRRPWDVIRHRDRALDHDLAILLRGETQALPDGVLAIGEETNTRIHPDALVYPGATLDAERGPIVIDAGATIRPGAIIVGPAYIGQHSTVIDRAFIKAHTAIGPVCKVAGEVGGCIIQGFTNKAHDGHLGDSFLGEWVNLGAGTTNSNLLNTYAEVIAQAEPRASKERTGLQYLGCIVGDHVKFAICSRIMTGSVLGTGCMFAASAPPPTVTGRFEWHTDRGAQPYRLSKFSEVARTVMARRNLEMSPAYEARLRELAKD